MQPEQVRGTVEMLDLNAKLIMMMKATNLRRKAKITDHTLLAPSLVPELADLPDSAPFPSMFIVVF